MRRFCDAQPEKRYETYRSLNGACSSFSLALLLSRKSLLIYSFYWLR
jgi:hypothetical protein